MITIISEYTDKTTDLVLEWIQDSKKVIRINYNTFSSITIHLNNFDQPQIRTATYNSSFVWFRRGRLQSIPNEIKNSFFYSYIKNEERPVIEFHEKLLSNKIKMIGSYQEENLNNKLLNLELARQCGLLIPETLVTNRKDELKKFFRKQKNIISKCIYHPININLTETKINSVGTVEVSKENIDFLADFFSTTLYQKYYEKKYEVRVFFFEDQFYPMAIFSQNDNKTKIDYRNYNKINPNRNVPFRLPSSVLKSIKKFIKLKKINTGSIDFIVTPNNDFIFLETNPQGQFHWLSANCNYYIEKSIANYLNNI